jgi:hypothetical protein
MNSYELGLEAGRAGRECPRPENVSCSQGWLIGRLDYYRDAAQAAEARANKADATIDEMTSHHRQDILRAVAGRDAHWQRIMQSKKKVRYRNRLRHWFRRRRALTADELCDVIDHMLAGRHPA